ncbi:MAG TPA: hypothetical protein VLA12_04550 [Planctomycetaceae bacterium]|nr:hypothetical protein [Planctomycetaceae bacterium]
MNELKPLDASAKTPEEIWLDFFSKSKPSDRTVRETVLWLSQGRRHDHVIALIESALIEGQPQPWMYEVLALSYELAKRPKEDSERALLSAIDPQVDFESMMLSSAYLSRFDNQKPALRLYRQASVRNPVRPEPYVMGLPIARKLNDLDAIRWAVEGILTYSWQGDFERHHRDAKIAAEEAIKQLRGQDRFREAREFQAALDEANVRDIVLELTWSGPGDIDLIVEEPTGSRCSFEIPQTASGGVHVRDGFGPKQENCHETYVCSRAISGNYVARIRHVQGQIVAGKALLKIIRHQNTDRESVKSFTISLGKDDQRVLFVLEEGRREKRDPTLEKRASAPRETSFRIRQLRLRQMTRGMTPAQQEVYERYANARLDNQAIGFASGAAVGISPIISTVSDGAMLSAGAVISPDRRYVRIGINANMTELIDIVRFSVFGGAGSGTQTPNGN